MIKHNWRIRSEYRKLYPDSMKFDRNYLCFEGWLRIKFKCHRVRIDDKYWEYKFADPKHETLFTLKFGHLL